MIKTLKIGATKFKIILLKEVGKWGTTLVDEGKIFVTPDATMKEKHVTIFHESLHAIIHQNGLNEHLSEGGEEVLVRVLESNIVRLFCDNKTFARAFIRYVLK